jgi:hypothetical protein
MIQRSAVRRFVRRVGYSHDERCVAAGCWLSRIDDRQIVDRSYASRAYCTTVNGTDPSVVSHVNHIDPPAPAGFFTTANVSFDRRVQGTPGHLHPAEVGVAVVVRVEAAVADGDGGSENGSSVKS